jgi:D-psicose/D-tagatose/L-ribulose 3-epimerase
MRFGLCTGDVEVIQQLRDWGYDYAEIGARVVVPFESDRTFADVKQRLVDTGTPIEAMAGFIPGSIRIVGPTVDQGQVRGYLETTISRAAEVGVKVINWGSAESRRVPPGWSMSRAWEQIERTAELIADLAEAAGIVVVVEPVNPREANILYYVTDALNLVQTINRASLRLLVDYYHVMKQNEPLEHVKAAADWLAHAHTSDDERRFPCLGQWDQRPFLGALVNAGYDGRLSFEVAKRDEAVYAEQAALSIGRLREVYRTVLAERS